MKVLLDQCFPQTVQDQIKASDVEHVNTFRVKGRTILLGRNDPFVYSQAVRRGFDCVITCDVNTFVQETCVTLRTTPDKLPIPVFYALGEGEMNSPKNVLAKLTELQRELDERAKAVERVPHTQRTAENIRTLDKLEAEARVSKERERQTELETGRTAKAFLDRMRQVWTKPVIEPVAERDEAAARKREQAEKAALMATANPKLVKCQEAVQEKARSRGKDDGHNRE